MVHNEYTNHTKRQAPCPAVEDQYKCYSMAVFEEFVSHYALFGHFFYLINLFLRYYGSWLRESFEIALSVGHAFPLFFFLFVCFILVFSFCFLKRERKKAWSWKGRAELMCTRSGWGEGGKTGTRIFCRENFIFNKSIKNKHTSKRPWDSCTWARRQLCLSFILEISTPHKSFFSFYWYWNLKMC